MVHLCPANRDIGYRRIRDSRFAAIPFKHAIPQLLFLDCYTEVGFYEANCHGFALIQHEVTACDGRTLHGIG